MASALLGEGVTGFHTCVRCGITCKPARHAPGIFCSKACGNASMRKYATKAEARKAERQRARDRNSIVCVGCGRPFVTAVANIRCPSCRRTPKLVFSATCRGCGVPIEGRRRKFCTVACGQSANRRVQHARDKRAKSKSGERIDPLAVFERDAWRCHLCGELTDRTKRGSVHRRAPAFNRW